MVRVERKVLGSGCRGHLFAAGHAATIGGALRPDVVSAVLKDGGSGCVVVSGCRATMVAPPWPPSLNLRVSVRFRDP